MPTVPPGCVDVEIRHPRNRIAEHAVAHEITAAIITAVGTLSATGVAVLGGLHGLRNWQREAIGRRQIQIAEECVASARRLANAIVLMATTYVYYDPAIVNFRNPAPEEIERRKQLYMSRLQQANECLVEFDGLCHVASIYLGRDLGQLSYDMWSIVFDSNEENFSHWSAMEYHEKDWKDAAKEYARFPGASAITHPRPANCHHTMIVERVESIYQQVEKTFLPILRSDMVGRSYTPITKLRPHVSNAANKAGGGTP